MTVQAPVDVLKPTTEAVLEISPFLSPIFRGIFFARLKEELLSLR
jgi:hypothetical protein